MSHIPPSVSIIRYHPNGGGVTEEYIEQHQEETRRQLRRGGVSNEYIPSLPRFNSRTSPFSDEEDRKWFQNARQDYLYYSGIMNQSYQDSSFDYEERQFNNDGSDGADDYNEYAIPVRRSSPPPPPPAAPVYVSPHVPDNMDMESTQVYNTSQEEPDDDDKTWVDPKGLEEFINERQNMVVYREPLSFRPPGWNNNATQYPQDEELYAAYGVSYDDQQQEPESPLLG